VKQLAIIVALVLPWLLLSAMDAWLRRKS